MERGLSRTFSSYVRKYFEYPTRQNVQRKRRGDETATKFFILIPIILRRDNGKRIKIAHENELSPEFNDTLINRITRPCLPLWLVLGASMQTESTWGLVSTTILWPKWQNDTRCVVLICGSFDLQHDQLKKFNPLNRFNECDNRGSSSS